MSRTTAEHFRPPQPRESTARSRIGVRDATHDYSGVLVLRDVDFEIRSGSVHGLVGENGSGKSTLIKILTGAIRPTRGELYLDESPISFHSPSDAKRHGVGVVHQDYNLFGELTVVDNVFGVGHRPPRRKWSRLIDRRAVDARVRQTLESLGIGLDPRALGKTLTAAERKLVEVARAMLDEPRYLILDEPTASLEPSASRHVLDLLIRLRERGVGVVFVSHRLDEVLKLADEVSVLRDGALIDKMSAGQATENRLVSLMMGKASKSTSSPGSRPGHHRRSVLRVRRLQVVSGGPLVDLSLREGEILGLTGLLGAGPGRVVRMLGGAEPLAGTLEVDGKSERIRTPRDATRLGIGFIPEDRKAGGLVLGSSVAMNVSLASIDKVSRHGVMSWKAVSRRAEEYRFALGIRCENVAAQVASLSGGNQQKVLLAKWLASGVRILVIEEPTHGVDVKGKAQIHELLRNFARQNGSVLMASTDVHEVVELCDRVALFRHGVLVEVLSTEQLTSAELALGSVQDPEHMLEQLVTGMPTVDHL